jgi:ABC-type multidrug transport system fused ATPase/permease subunit
LKQLHITQIVVTHRLNAIQDADTIYVVEKGKIIESGTHVELLQLKGAYYDSVNN